MTWSALQTYLKTKGWYSGRSGLYLIGGYSGRRQRIRREGKMIQVEADFWRDGKYVGYKIPLSELHLYFGQLRRSVKVRLPVGKKEN